MKHPKLMLPVIFIISIIFFILSYLVYFFINRSIGITLFAVVFGLIISAALIDLLYLLSKVSK